MTTKLDTPRKKSKVLRREVDCRLLYTPLPAPIESFFHCLTRDAQHYYFHLDYLQTCIKKECDFQDCPKLLKKLAELIFTRPQGWGRHELRLAVLDLLDSDSLY